MTDRLRAWLCAAAIAACAFLVYSRTLSNGFVWDDHIYVEGNAFLRQPGAWRVLLSGRPLTPSGVPLTAAARPAFVASLLADRAAWGDGPRGYHLTNALLHALCAALVLALSLEFFPLPLAAAAALLFAVHPANSEAVSLVSFRPDILAALFVLAALWLQRRWRRQESLAAAAAGIAGCALLYGLGLLSKEMAATFPALALLLEAAPPRVDPPRRARLAAALAVYAVVAAGYAYYRSPRSGYAAVGQSASPAPAKPGERAAVHLTVLDPSPPPWQRMYPDLKVRALTMTGALGQELGVLAAGAPLRADRAPALVDSPLSWRVWGTLLALAAAAGGAALAWRRGRTGPALALGWILVAWLPVSGAARLYNPVAERYLYLLAVGAAWAWALAAEALAGVVAPGRRWAPAAAAALLAAPWALRTIRRTADWRNDEALWLREALLGTENPRVLYNLGVDSLNRKDYAAAQRRFEAAVNLYPNYHEALTDLGHTLCVENKRGCLGILKEASAQDPRSFVAARALGQELARRGRHGEAVEAFARAYEASRRLDRDSALGLADSALRSGRRLEDGRKAAQEEIGRSPADRDTLRLFALLCWRAGLADRAAAAAGGGDKADYAALARLLQAHGWRGDAAKAYQLGLSRGSSPGAGEGLAELYMTDKRYDLAAQLLENEAADPKKPYARLNLGVCEQHLGHPQRAVALLEQAIGEGARSAEAYYDLGAAYEALPDGLPKAREALEKALKRSPRYADAWYELGVVHLRSGRRREALEAFTKAGELDPKRIEALNNQAALLAEDGALDRAERVLKRALAVSPANPSLHNNLGEVRLRQNRPQEAAEEFRAAIRNTPADPSERPNLERYQANLARCGARP